MRRRPTRRALAVGGVGTLLIMAGSTAQAGWLFVLAAGVLGVIAASAFVRHGLATCDVSRTLAATIRVGDDVRVGLALRNRGRRSLPLIRLEDRLEVFEPARVVVERLAPAATAHIEIVRTAQRRGMFTSGDAVVSSGWPFGLFRSKRSVAASSPVMVVPRWAELRSFPILEPSSFPSEALHERARTGAGLDYLGVREYRPGDSPRAVHWRSSARTGSLVVREYEEQAQSRVALVVAGRDDGTPPDSPFEMLVSAAASIALYAVVTGHPVDLIGAAGEGGIEHLGDADRVGALRWLAKAQPNEAPLRPLVSAAMQRLGRRGTVVILVPSAGRTGMDLSGAVRAVQASGSRVIAVVARSDTWSDKAASADGHRVAEQLGGRTFVRILSKGGDLRRCLES